MLPSCSIPYLYSEKFTRSILIATRKRGIDEEQVERMVGGLIRQLETSGEVEVASRRLGELAIKALAGLDQVACVRFASVYHDFTSAKDFEEFVGRLDDDTEA